MTLSSMSLRHQLPDGCSSSSVVSSPTDPRGHHPGADRSHHQLENDVGEELELPLPLRSDEELYAASLPPRCHSHVYHPPMDFRRCPPAAKTHNHCAHLPAHSSHQWAQCQLRPPWARSQNWIHSGDSFRSHSSDWGCVSVNVPQFSVPRLDAVSEVRAEAAASQETRQILPHECRNVFITYSSDSSQEMAPLVEFLSEQGFRPAIDLLDDPVRQVDVNRWEDSYLQDPLTLIIVAISPKYKADIEGSEVDPHGLHTKYIHSMMQQEFIQRGSLNYRFIPVLFLDATQKHVPGWLQNTRVFRWPRDTVDLLLRLRREERFVPPPVPTELTLVIRPVTSSGATVAP